MESRPSWPGHMANQKGSGGANEKVAQMPEHDNWHMLDRLEKLEQAHSLHVNEVRETLKNIERTSDRLALILEGVTERESKAVKTWGRKYIFFSSGRLSPLSWRFVYDGGLKK